jgi:hypothetical protein
MSNSPLLPPHIYFVLSDTLTGQLHCQTLADYFTLTASSSSNSLSDVRTFDIISDNDTLGKTSWSVKFISEVRITTLFLFGRPSRRCRSVFPNGFYFIICDSLNEILSSSNIRRRIVGWLVSGETEGMWKEEVVAYSEALWMPLSGITEKKRKTLIG